MWLSPFKPPNKKITLLSNYGYHEQIGLPENREFTGGFHLKLRQWSLFSSFDKNK